MFIPHFSKCSSRPSTVDIRCPTRIGMCETSQCHCAQESAIIKPPCGRTMFWKASCKGFQLLPLYSCVIIHKALSFNFSRWYTVLYQHELIHFHKKKTILIFSTERWHHFCVVYFIIPPILEKCRLDKECFFCLIIPLHTQIHKHQDLPVVTTHFLLILCKNNHQPKCK